MPKPKKRKQKEHLLVPADLRKGHTNLSKRLKGREKEFIKRAARRGVGTIQQLSRLTGLKKERVRKIVNSVPKGGEKTKKFTKKKKTKRFLKEGEKPFKEIARLTGSTPKAVSVISSRLRKKGIKPNIKHMKTPPAKLARVYYRLQVLEEMGIEHGKLELAAGKDIGYSTLQHQHLEKPELKKQIKELVGGKYWRKAKQYVEKVENFREKVKKGKWRKTDKTKRVEKLLKEGKKTVKEIAKETGASRDAIRTTRSKLRKQGIKTNLRGTSIPPVSLARVVYKMQALEKARGTYGSIKEATKGEKITPEILYQIRSKHPEWLKEIKTLNNGKYWEKAKMELEKEK